MPAIVRVKRRINEEPQSAFVLNGKRRRVQDGKFGVGLDTATTTDEAAANSDAKDEISTILKFAGTLEEQDNTATTHFVRQSKDAARELVHQKVRKPNNATDRARNEVRQTQIENRFRVVNCLRTTLADTDAPKDLTILDIERHDDNSSFDADAAAARDEASVIIHHNNAVIDAHYQATDYVYDVYLPEDEQHAAHVDLLNDNYLSVRPFDDIIYEDCFNNDDDENDSEDSNQENHVGNDYPDEDEYDDADDFQPEPDAVRQMREAVATFVFDDEEENEEEETAAGELNSSSDEDCNPFEDPYIHSVNTDSFATDDVDRYGRAYARYKARILKQMNSGTTDEEKDEDGERDDTKNDSDSDDEYYHSASENENDN